MQVKKLLWLERIKATVIKCILVLHNEYYPKQIRSFWRQKTQCYKKFSLIKKIDSIPERDENIVEKGKKKNKYWYCWRKKSL